MSAAATPTRVIGNRLLFFPPAVLVTAVLILAAQLRGVGPRQESYSGV